MSESIESDPRDRSSFSFRATRLRKVAVSIADLALRPLIRLEVEGLHNMPATGAVILASNHITNFDVFPMQLAVPRPIFFMGKAELFRFPPIGALLGNFGAFPVYRGEKDAWAVRHARKVLDHGQTLGMFPEGRRSRGWGLGIAKTGTAKLALDANCPIVPMILIGSNQFLKTLPRRTRIHISVLCPIQPGREESPEHLTDRLMCTLASALPEAMRGAYASSAPKL